MKCSKCNELKFEMVWVKTMKIDVLFDPIALDLKDDLDPLVCYARLELIKMVSNDVKHGINAGETLYCNDCYKELDK